MHCVNIAVDRIVDQPGSTPRAHGTAIYSSGSIVEFIAYLDAPYEQAYVHPPGGPGSVHPHHEFLPIDIITELGFYDINERERRAHAPSRDYNSQNHSPYTLERIAACRELMTDEIRERVAANRQHIIDTCF